MAKISTKPQDHLLTDYDTLIGTEATSRKTLGYYLLAIFNYVHNKITGMYLNVDGSSAMTGDLAGIDAEFSGKVKGITPVDLDDLVTRGYLKATFGGSEPINLFPVDGSEDLLGEFKGTYASFSSFISAASPTASNHLVTLEYSDNTYARSAELMPIDGSLSMTGRLNGEDLVLSANLTVNKPPETNESIVNLSHMESLYVKNHNGQVDGFIRCDGVAVFTERITVSTPVDDTDLANRKYLESKISGGQAFPSGLIIMWAGILADIPEGWVLCDNQNGTPDVANRFVTGAVSTNRAAAIGGSADRIVVEHNHTATFTGTAYDPHTHSNTLIEDNSDGYTFELNNDDDWQVGGVVTEPAEYGIPTAVVTVSPYGDVATGANMPPYVKLAFIMKL